MVAAATSCILNMFDQCARKMYDEGLLTKSWDNLAGRSALMRTLRSQPKRMRAESSMRSDDGFEPEKELDGQFQSMSAEDEMFRNDFVSGQESNVTTNPELTVAATDMFAGGGRRKLKNAG
jgi:hypothetical protein